MKHTSTSIVAILALVVAIISAIPPFLSLNEDKANIFYSHDESGIQIPNSMDNDKVRKILSENKIPTDTVKIQLVNQGNVEAEKVKIALSVKGTILSAGFQPSFESNPIWVSLPKLGIDSNPDSLQFSVDKLAIGKVLDFEIAYERNKEGLPEIQMFSNGKAASIVSNIYQVEPWSPFKVFYTPTNNFRHWSGFSCTLGYRDCHI